MATSQQTILQSNVIKITESFQKLSLIMTELNLDIYVFHAQTYNIGLYKPQTAQCESAPISFQNKHNFRANNQTS